ncbi:MAG: hypothetical protein HYZ81_17075, partial [Nitrospinae bacterium]|nr:hypothetical protein [Nitrospinota bacterium]
RVAEETVRAAGRELVVLDEAARAPEAHAEAGDREAGAEAQDPVGQVLRAGDYYRAAAGTVHDVTHTEGGCVFLLIASRVEVLG